MRFYLYTLSFLLLVTGCTPEPKATLAPKLSHYATAKQQCSDFIAGKSTLDTAVEKECDLFIKRLGQTNALAYELSSKTFKKSETHLKETEYARERLRLKNRYNKLSKAVQEATLAVIRKDNTEAFIRGVEFPGNTFIAPYYEYMRSKSPQFDNNTYYLEYQRQESTRLISKAEHYLKQNNKSKALIRFEKAANLNSAQAARSTGLLYEKSNLKKAFYWHNRAVEGGVKASSLNLAFLYEADGQNELALEWYHRAAKNNNVNAQYQLYRLNIAKDKSVAISWLKKSADGDYTLAQYDYALVLMHESKIDEAISLLEKASQNGYSPASDYLGKYFYDLKLYRSAFEQLKHSESGISFYLRAKMLEKGDGVQQDSQLAATFYSLAANLGKKEAGKDLKRLNTLILKQQQRQAAQEKKLRKAQMAAMVKECGKAPTPATIKKRDRRFHITGIASAPLGRRSFIIYGDDGKEYYLLRARGIKEGDHVDISIRATGSTASISVADEEESVDIYQFTFIKECVIDEQEQ